MTKKKSFNYARNRKKLGKKIKAPLKISSDLVDSVWKRNLSVKANFDKLGLAYSANEVLLRSTVKAMSRDPKNVYQLTPKQIERLILKFKQTSDYVTFLKEGSCDGLDLQEIYEMCEM